MRSIVQKALLTVCALLSAQVAEATTSASLVKDAETVDSVTTSAAVRANADVQIRRIKNLMVIRKIDGVATGDTAMIKIERLQKDLRGEK